MLKSSNRYFNTKYCRKGLPDRPTVEHSKLYNIIQSLAVKCLFKTSFEQFSKTTFAANANQPDTPDRTKKEHFNTTIIGISIYVEFNKPSIDMLVSVVVFLQFYKSSKKKEILA